MHLIEQVKHLSRQILTINFYEIPTWKNKARELIVLMIIMFYPLFCKHIRHICSLLWDYCVKHNDRISEFH